MLPYKIRKTDKTTRFFKKGLFRIFSLKVFIQFNVVLSETYYLVRNLSKLNS